MCECLCGEVKGDFNFQVGPTDVVTVDIYRGCTECDPLIGVDIRVFNAEGAKDWLGGAEIVSVIGDGYGGRPTVKSIPILSVEALADVFRGYGHDEAADLLEWQGMTMLQDAMARTAKRYTG